MVADCGHGRDPDNALIRVGRIFDGTRLTSADSVLVRGGVIEDVGPGIVPPPELRVVDDARGTLVPGLIGSHTHALRERNLAAALVFG